MNTLTRTTNCSGRFHAGLPLALPLALTNPGRCSLQQAAFPAFLPTTVYVNGVFS